MERAPDKLIKFCALRSANFSDSVYHLEQPPEQSIYFSVWYAIFDGKKSTVHSYILFFVNGSLMTCRAVLREAKGRL